MMKTTIPIESPRGVREPGGEHGTDAGGGPGGPKRLGHWLGATTDMTGAIEVAGPQSAQTGQPVVGTQGGKGPDGGHSLITGRLSRGIVCVETPALPHTASGKTAVFTITRHQNPPLLQPRPKLRHSRAYFTTSSRPDGMVRSPTEAKLQFRSLIRLLMRLLKLPLPGLCRQGARPLQSGFTNSRFSNYSCGGACWAGMASSIRSLTSM